MSAAEFSLSYPDKSSPDLCLAHPTPSECLVIWKSTSSCWRDALSTAQYLQESAYLLTVPLAKENGMTMWILVDRHKPPDHRAIYSSCETIRKRALAVDLENELVEGIVYGVASVFTDGKYRGKGYASRMMQELSVALGTWQAEHVSCLGSILFSDIGKDFYQRFGWLPALDNNHVEFPATATVPSSTVRPLTSTDLPELCARDEELLRDRMVKSGRGSFAIVPDIDHIFWHHSKENFATEKLFGRTPDFRGALIGDSGARLWVIWTHRYYGDPKTHQSDNTLYILRLVVEGDIQDYANCSDARKKLLKNNLQDLIGYAQHEAFRWELSNVKLWNPSTVIQHLISISQISHTVVDRLDESIASLLLFDHRQVVDQPPQIKWLANEKYAWL